MAPCAAAGVACICGQGSGNPGRRERPSVASTAACTLKRAPSCICSSAPPPGSGTAVSTPPAHSTCPAHADGQAETRGDSRFQACESLQMSRCEAMHLLQRQ
jgi:hypothetical protein